MSTPVLDADTEVVVNDQAEDAPPQCVICEEPATRVPVCPVGHIVRVKSTDGPGYMCEKHAKQYPRYLFMHITHGHIMQCFECNRTLDGTTIPLP